MIPRPPWPDFERTRLDEVCSRLELRLVVLFGSRATGSPPPAADSDLDLAIAFPHGHRHAFWECHDGLSELFPGHAIDLALLPDADPLFRWEIMDRGVLLWGDPDEYLEYRAFAYRDFVDSADLRALERLLSERKLVRIRERLHAAP